MGNRRLAAAAVALVASAWAMPVWAEIKIYFESPTSEDFFGDTLEIEVAVISTIEVGEVKAEAEGNETILAWDHGDVFAGSLDITALAWGSHQVTVTAKDAFGQSASKSASFTKDKPPQIVIYSPTFGTVANPFVHVHAECYDDGPQGCDLYASADLVEYGLWWDENDFVVLGEGIDHIELDANVEKLDGNRIYYYFGAWDASGLSTYIHLDGYVNTSPNLVPVDSVPAGKIVDFDDKRILFVASDEYDWQPGPGNQYPKDPKIALYERETKDVKVLGKGECTSEYACSKCALTPSGALFRVGCCGSDKSGYGLMLFSDGEWPPKDMGNADACMEVTGNHAIWVDGFDLFHYVFSADMLTKYSWGVNNLYNDVAGNGDIVFSNAVAEVYRLRGEELTQVEGIPGLYRWWPTTDGVNVVYECSSPENYEKGKPGICLYDQSGNESYLAPEGQDKIWGVQGRYQVNNGWIAHTKNGPTGVQQVWVRTPLGVDNQVTFFGVDSEIEWLGADGEVFFFSCQGFYAYEGLCTLYRAFPGNEPKEVKVAEWQALGDVRQLGGDWYVMLGRSLFKVVESVVPCAPGDACDDGDPCTKDDVCDAKGKCTGKPVAGCGSIEPAPDMVGDQVLVEATDDVPHEDVTDEKEIEISTQDGIGTESEDETVNDLVELEDIGLTEVLDLSGEQDECHEQTSETYDSPIGFEDAHGDVSNDYDVIEKEGIKQGGAGSACLIRRTTTRLGGLLSMMLVAAWSTLVALRFSVGRRRRSCEGSRHGRPY